MLTGNILEKGYCLERAGGGISAILLLFVFLLFFCVKKKKNTRTYTHFYLTAVYSIIDQLSKPIFDLIFKKYFIAFKQWDLTQIITTLDSPLHKHRLKASKWYNSV